MWKSSYDAFNPSATIAGIAIFYVKQMVVTEHTAMLHAEHNQMH